MIRIVALFLVIFCGVSANAQKKNYTLRTVAFYNVENLFDIENDTLIFDDDRTPNGKDHWTQERYDAKIEAISRVLSKIGAETSNTSPDIIGVCEVENLSVLNDLIYHKNLSAKNYGIVHEDSPDERGIDVGLLYNKDVFLPLNFQSRRLLLNDDEGKRNYTRDQLVVEGLLDDEVFYFIVNHWPSRSGGEAKSKPNRIAAAKLNRAIIDSIQQIDVNANIISMGDLNDDPIDDSLKKIIKTEGKISKNDTVYLYNPMEKMYKKGIGTLAYRDRWNLFDQIYFTSTLLQKSNGYQFWKAGVFKAPFLSTKKGPYKNYPFRTYAGGSYTGGYSDHFPVYLFLLKKL